MPPTELLSKPFRLWTLRELMETFKLEKLVAATTNLAHMASSGLGETGPLSMESTATLLANLRDLKFSAMQVGLNTTLITIGEIFESFRDGSSVTMSTHDYAQVLAELLRTVNRELSTHVFLNLTYAHRRYFNREAMFGGAVDECFPDAADDINAAGTCLALDLGTAAVFYLMRVIEAGIVKLTALIGMKDPKPSWEGMLRYIDVELKKPYPEMSPEAQKHKQFLEEIHPHLDTLRRGIRNKVDHVGNHIVPTAAFPPQKAEAILIATREVMQSLATELQK